jgi:hypothetical protein
MNAMETRIIQDLRRSNFLKSWLIFYRFGLKDFLMRATLMSIFDNVARCIPRFGDLEEWKFNEVFCHPPPANDLSVEEAAFEMYEYYKYWMERTFNPLSTIRSDTLGNTFSECIFFVCHKVFLIVLNTISFI